MHLNSAYCHCSGTLTTLSGTAVAAAVSVALHILTYLIYQSLVLLSFSDKFSSWNFSVFSNCSVQYCQKFLKLCFTVVTKSSAMYALHVELIYVCCLSLLLLQ